MAPQDPAELDPITVEVVRHKLDGIANEMQSTLLRTSFSPIVKEGLDASASLFTPGRHDAGAVLLDPDPSRDADPGGGGDIGGLSGRDDARGRRLYPQRSLLRRHAPAGYRGGHAGHP